METPSILKRGYFNESQQIKMTTTKLTPNSTSNYTTRFQIPSIGAVLDSNSALIWNLSWRDYDDAAVTTEKVCLKNFSGGLNSISRARFYINGKLIFQNEDVGAYVHMMKQALNPDTLQNVTDYQIGSQHGYYLDSEGRYCLGKDSSKIETSTSEYVRAIGSGTKAVQISLLLSDIFKGLNFLQIPCSIFDLRLEIDWNTTWDDCVFSGGTAIPVGRRTLDIVEPLLLLDYLDYGMEDNMMLQEIMKKGIALPFINVLMINKTIPENLTADVRTDDLQINLSGKLLMKIYASHRTADSITVGLLNVLQPCYIGNGRCRSERGKNFSYNLFINDLSLYDRNIDTASQQYDQLSQAFQSLPCVMGGMMEYVDTVAPVSADDVVGNDIVIGGEALETDQLDTTLIRRNLIAGTQSYIGFDLSKYGSGEDQILPSNAGYRINNSPIVLRILQSGGAADTKLRAPKTVQIFVEEVKILQIRGKDVDVFDA